MAGERLFQIIGPDTVNAFCSGTLKWVMSSVDRRKCRETTRARRRRKKSQANKQTLTLAWEKIHFRGTLGRCSPALQRDCSVWTERVCTHKKGLLHLIAESGFRLIPPEPKRKQERERELVLKSEPRDDGRRLTIAKHTQNKNRNKSLWITTRFEIKDYFLRGHLLYMSLVSGTWLAQSSVHQLR